MKGSMEIRPKSLTERESLVLCSVVQKFIQDGVPVASRNLAEMPELNVSSATIRNILFQLEAYGLLTHPHTSAGRIPTQEGYRYYVD
ncbi:MAG: heat-inducible transcription repressor HrcA, partial [Candidatus Marinimicrobia bacterium CG_4_9_14_3_um_filter_48_9]